MKTRHGKTAGGPSTGRATGIAFANHKGGTGKTTSCLSIAGCLAKGGSRVLVVDFDPQGNATSGLGIDKQSLGFTVYDAILGQCPGQRGVPIARVIVETDVDNLHLAPAEFDLSVAERLMQGCRNRTTILERTLDPVRARYDYILIDLPPSAGLLTINGLCAADLAVVPVDPSLYSLDSLDDLQRTFQDIRQYTGRSLRTLGAVLIRHVKAAPGVAGPCQQVEAALKEMFRAVFVVPATDDVFATQQQGLPISHVAPDSPLGKAYDKIARTIRTQAKKPATTSKP